MASKLKNVGQRFGVSNSSEERRKVKDLDATGKTAGIKGGALKSGGSDTHSCLACPHPGFPNYHTASRT